MNKYLVSVEETIIQTYTVEGVDHDDAVRKAEELYKQGHYTTTGGYVSDAQLAVNDEPVGSYDDDNYDFFTVRRNNNNRTIAHSELSKLNLSERLTKHIRTVIDNRSDISNDDIKFISNLLFIQAQVANTSDIETIIANIDKFELVTDLDSEYKNKGNAVIIELDDYNKTIYKYNKYGK